MPGCTAGVLLLGCTARVLGCNWVQGNANQDLYQGCRLASCTLIGQDSHCQCPLTCQTAREVLLKGRYRWVVNFGGWCVTAFGKLLPFQLRGSWEADHRCMVM